MADSNLLILQYEVGLMENFVYFVGDAKKREVLVVDPAWEIDTIFDHAKEEDLTIKGALITHHHYDHTNGIDELTQSLDVPVYVHEKDIPYLEMRNKNIKPTQGGEKIKVGNIEVELIHTPGHTPGSQCFHVHDNLVSGDTMFINACGRCDFEGGNAEEMYNSLHKRLGKLPGKTILYPGHNYAADRTSDTFDNQRKTNPYLLVDSLQNFLRLRM